MRMLVRPHGDGSVITAERSPIAKPDHRIVGIERGDHDLADLALRHRIAGAGAHDLDQHGLVDDHAFARLALVGDDAELGGGVALQHRDAARGEFLPQRGRQRRAGNEAAPERGGLAGLLGGVEQDLQKVRRADIASRLEMRDRLELLLGIAGAGRDDRAAERMRAPTP